MQELYGLVSELSAILALGIGACFINVLLHELGHAIPILFWSKQKVFVFVGNLGSMEKCFHLPFGRLFISVTYNPFLWIRGLCQATELLPIRKRIFYTMTGPLTSLFVGVLCLVILKTQQLEERTVIIFVTIMVVAAVFTLSSIIPSPKLSSSA